MTTKRLDTGNAVIDVTGNAAHVLDGFVPSGYASTLTMTATGAAVALSADAVRVRVTNVGATTEAVRIAFGESDNEARDAIAISSGAATAGGYIGALADVGAAATVVLKIPTLARYLAIAPAVAGDTQTVIVEQGI